jgi:hypothetical protein
MVDLAVAARQKVAQVELQQSLVHSFMAIPVVDQLAAVELAAVELVR